MSKFGFKYQEINEEIEVEDEFVTGKCVYCGKQTDLILEHGDTIKVQIPICKKHRDKIKPKEQFITYGLNQLIQFIMTK